MRQTTIMLVAGLVLAGGATALSLSADPAPAADAATDGDDTQAAADAEVTVQDFEFSDADTGTPVTHVQVGDTVRWTWEGGCHSVTQGVRGPGSEPVGPSAFDSGVQCTSYDEDGTPTSTFTVTFDEPGAYKYFCKPHASMEGLVVVDAAS